MKKYTVILLVMGFFALSFGEPVDGAPSNGEDLPRDMSDVRASINEIKEVVQRDYEALLVTDPEASGTVTVSFLITSEGTVADVSIDCPGALTVLREDITSVLEEIDFGPVPEQIEDIPVTVPFTLTPPE
ncbi:MAG: hypothetical protein KAH54_12055 [Candidatus Sabulitectum sp.]|nr:hypothetical protein [Candidatus Sabulitectum sp.]